jgi:hypothetical protein
MFFAMSPVNRRQALKSLGVAALVSSSELFSLARQARAQLDGEDRHIFRSLDPEQNELVTVVSELILPETDTPGAKAARVNEFVDVMLTNWFDESERSAFYRGLRQMDDRARAAHGERFVGCTNAAQVEILTELEREALETAEDLESTRGAAQSSDSPASQPFFNVMKWLTLHGYFTSEIGMEQELHHVVFPGSYEGCTPLQKG